MLGFRICTLFGDLDHQFVQPFSAKKYAKADSDKIPTLPVFLCSPNDHVDQITCVHLLFPLLATGARGAERAVRIWNVQVTIPPPGEISPPPESFKK